MRVGPGFPSRPGPVPSAKEGRREAPMKSFGRLLRKLRGSTPLAALAQRTALDTGYLGSLEAGRRVADEFVARLILGQGFELEAEDVTRLILGVQLYDLG